METCSRHVSPAEDRQRPLEDRASLTVLTEQNVVISVEVTQEFTKFHGTEDRNACRLHSTRHYRQYPSQHRERRKKARKRNLPGNQIVGLSTEGRFSTGKMRKGHYKN